MELSDIKKGIHVILSSTCSHTKRNYGWNDEMDRFKGTVQKIQNINMSSVNFNCGDGYNWSPKDFEPTSLVSEKKPSPFLFDVDKLDL